MKTVAQWQAKLRDLRRIVKNTEAREMRASEARWGQFVKCDKCGNMHRADSSEKAQLKYELERDLGWEQRSYIYSIQNWLVTLREYNKGEPSEPS